MFIAFFGAALDRPLRWLLAGLAIALTAGCSSVPIGNEAAKPPEAPRTGYATLHVGRPTGFNVSVFPVTIDIDGKTVGSLAPGRYMTVELAPGKHTLEVPNNAWSRAINGIPHQVEFTTAAGKTYYALPFRQHATRDHGRLRRRRRSRGRSSQKLLGPGGDNAAGGVRAPELRDAIVQRRPSASPSCPDRKRADRHRCAASAMRHR